MCNFIHTYIPTHLHRQTLDVGNRGVAKAYNQKETTDNNLYENNHYGNSNEFSPNKYSPKNSPDKYQNMYNQMNTEGYNAYEQNEYKDLRGVDNRNMDNHTDMRPGMGTMMDVDLDERKMKAKQMKKEQAIALQGQMRWMYICIYPFYVKE